MLARAQDNRARADLILPDFYGIGPARTATTWLHAVLEGHVGLPFRVKETEFFTKYYDRGIEWYARYFRHCQPDRPVGEICPCFAVQKARARIADCLPQCRIICTFRDPVERGYSMYKLMCHYAAIREIGFETALSSVPDISESSRYAHHLRAWQSMFGKERVLVMFYDDLRADEQAFLDRVCDFIAAPRLALGHLSVSQRARHSFVQTPRNYRLARKARRLRQRLKDRRMYLTIKLLERARVWDFCFGRGEEFRPLDRGAETRIRQRFIPEIEALEEMTGRDLSAWKQPRVAREPGRYGSTVRGSVGA